MRSSNPARVRKNYDSLEDWERQRFWACFKFLYLMDSDDTLTNGKKRNYVVPITPRTDSKGEFSDTFIYECQSKFQEIIGIHATTCEHGTNFFGYFHRMYLIYVEIALFRADRILRGVGGEVTPKVFENNGDRFRKIQEEYKAIVGNREEAVSIPYWSGLDYRKKIDIPEILRKPERSNTPQLDSFFLEITGENFGFMNFQNQWYQYSPRQRIPETNNMFSDYWYGNR